MDQPTTKAHGFKGDHLFGVILDEINILTGGKSTYLSQLQKSREPHHKPGPSFSAQKWLFHSQGTLEKSSMRPWQKNSANPTIKSLREGLPHLLKVGGQLCLFANPCIFHVSGNLVCKLIVLCYKNSFITICLTGSFHPISVYLCNL